MRRYVTPPSREARIGVSNLKVITRRATPDVVIPLLEE